MNSTTKLSIDLNGFTTFCEQNMSARFRPNSKGCILSAFLNENCPCGRGDHHTDHLNRAGLDTDLTVHCSTLNETCLTISYGTNLKIYKAVTQNTRTLLSTRLPILCVGQPPPITYTGSDILSFIRKTTNQEPGEQT